MEIRTKSESVRRILEAASTGDTAYLHGSVQDDHALKNAVCNSGCTALHWAAGTNQLNVMEYLIQTRKIFSVDVLAVKKSRGRTPLHYACRNGCFEACQWLVESASAQVDPRAKHGVTPFQLAVWQNKLDICKWLVEIHKVDPCQVNDFDCGAVHWLGISPYIHNHTNVTSNTQNGNGDVEYHNDNDSDYLLPLAKWLAAQPGMNFSKTQRQGHTPLHKAAWGGHLALVKYLRDVHGLWDDSRDDAGNYAADLADMAQTPRHTRIAEYLRSSCSLARAKSCAILGVPATADELEIRKAFLERARQVHPDRKKKQQTSSDTEGANATAISDDFDDVRKAYDHLTKEGGVGNQSNPAHSLKLMLQVSGEEQSSEQQGQQQHHHVTGTTTFKACLIAVLLEYGDKGLDLSNVKKKWNQVWSDEPFPTYEKGSLSNFLIQQAGDVIELVPDGRGTRVFAKTCSQAKVQAAANNNQAVV